MQTCTRPAALTTITQPQPGCEVKFDQIIRLLFQRRQDTPSFATDVEFKDIATWTPLLTALADTKVVLSPLFAGMTIPQSEGLFEGGNDNTTIDGVEVYKGEGAVRVTGTFTGLPFATAEELRKLSTESYGGLTDGLTAYMVNREGEIVHEGDYGGIPITNFRLSSVGSEGFGAGNKYTFSFSVPGNWDATIGITKPTFNPRFDI